MPNQLIDSNVSTNSLVASVAGQTAQLPRFERFAPIILDLDGKGITTLAAAKTTVRFDWDGDGLADDTAWIGKTEGFLFLDRNKDGKLTDPGELSFVADLAGATTDLEGLRSFDSNTDGSLTTLDTRFADFRIWQDKNGNGVADDGEVLTLTAAGIKSLDLKGTVSTSAKNPGDIWTLNTGSYTRTDGTTQSFIDATVTYFSAPRDGLAKLDFTKQAFEKKAKKYRLTTKDGVISITDKHGNPVSDNLDARAAGLTGSFEMSFRNGSYGILTPLVLDLDGDGVSFTKISKANGQFDMNGDGASDEQGWISANDGFLVVDRNNNGKIDNGAELSLLSEDPTAHSSLAALAVFDSNADRTVDDKDARFGELKVWVDANRNGVTDTGELKSLKDMGIESISLDARFVNGKNKLGNSFLLATSVFKRTNGTLGTAGDAALTYRPSASPLVAATSPAPVTVEPTPTPTPAAPTDPLPGTPVAGSLADAIAAPTDPQAPTLPTTPGSSTSAMAALQLSAAIASFGAGTGSGDLSGPGGLIPPTQDLLTAAATNGGF